MDTNRRRPPLSDELNMHERRRLRAMGKNNEKKERNENERKSKKNRVERLKEMKEKYKKYNDFIMNEGKEIEEDFKYLVKLRDMFDHRDIDRTPIANFIYHGMTNLDKYEYSTIKKLQIIYKKELIPAIVVKIESIVKHVIDVDAWKDYSYFDQYLDAIIKRVCIKPQEYINVLREIVNILKRSFDGLMIDDLMVGNEILDELAELFNTERLLLYSDNINCMRITNILYHLDELINNNTKITIIPSERRRLKEKIEELNSVKTYLLDRISDSDVHILQYRLNNLNI
jgi:hypothetical protein